MAIDEPVQIFSQANASHHELPRIVGWVAASHRCASA
jgi:hypothetical protein